MFCLLLLRNQQQALDQREGVEVDIMKRKRSSGQPEKKSFTFSRDLKERKRSFTDIKTAFEKLKLCDSLALGHIQRA